MNNALVKKSKIPAKKKKKKKKKKETGKLKMQTQDNSYPNKHLGGVWIQRLWAAFAFFFFFFLESLLLTFSCEQCTPVGPVYYSQDSQNSLFNNFFTINGSHDTVHIFKNYFATIFSVFSFQFSIFSCIQTNP